MGRYLLVLVSAAAFTAVFSQTSLHSSSSHGPFVMLCDGALEVKNIAQYIRELCVLLSVERAASTHQD